MSALTTIKFGSNEIRVEWAYGDDTRRYVLNKLISRSDKTVLKRPMPHRGSRDAKKIGLVGCELVSFLFGIEGVEYIELNPHDVLISKGKLFDWAQIHERVIFALALIFDNDLPFHIAYAEEVRARHENPDREIEILTEALTLHSCSL